MNSGSYSSGAHFRTADAVWALGSKWSQSVHTQITRFKILPKLFFVNFQNLKKARHKRAPKLARIITGATYKTRFEQKFSFRESRLLGAVVMQRAGRVQHLTHSAAIGRGNVRTDAAGPSAY